MIVNQWVPAAHEGDAVGDNARQLRALFRHLGHQSDIFALSVDESLHGDVLPWSFAETRGGDITILHFAMPSPGPTRRSSSIRKAGGCSAFAKASASFRRCAA